MSSAPTLAPAFPPDSRPSTCKLKLRTDLIVQPQFYEGMTHYVVKDPIALKYFRFKVEEYFLLQQFDGKKTSRSQEEFEKKYRPQTITIEDLFASPLNSTRRPCAAETPEQAKALITRRRKNQWKRPGNSSPTSLYVKIPIIDPEKLAQRNVPILPLDLYS